MRPLSITSFVILLSLLTAQSNFSQWQQTAMTTGSVTSLAATQTHIFALSNSVYSTVNNGTTWDNTGMAAADMCANSIRVFVIVSSTSVYSSANNGVNWSHLNISYADGLACITADNNNIYAGSIHYGIGRSTNNGSSWSPAPGFYGSIYCIAADGNLIFAERQGALYLSTDFGESWSQTSMPINSINSIVINGSSVYAGTDNNGVYISADNGATWNQSALNNQTVSSIAVTGSNVFAGTSNGGVYFSNNGGASWVQKNEGLTNLSADALLINGNFIYAGTVGAGVWKRSLNELVGINTVSNEIPSNYSLSQNYPNPFNPSTNIKFSLPVSGFTTLNVYDAAGKIVSTLVNSEMKAGVYQADFNASSLASGIYFYTLSSGDFIKTNKMVLVK